MGEGVRGCEWGGGGELNVSEFIGSKKGGGGQN